MIHKPAGQISRFIACHRRLVIYLVSGTLAAGVEYGSFFALVNGLEANVYLSNSISFGLGLQTSFLLNRLWTFGGRQFKRRTTHQFGYYVALALGNLLLTNIFLGAISNTGVDLKISKLAAMVLTSGWNYLLFKHGIFKHRDEPEL